MRTLHVGLRVGNLKRSLDFYGALGYEAVGAVPDSDFGSLTMLKLTGDDVVSLELVDEPTAATVEARTLHHLVVQVEDLGATIARLAARGIRADAPASPDGSDDFLTTWIVDPDGNRIELVQWPRGHADGLTAADFPT